MVEIGEPKLKRRLRQFGVTIVLLGLGTLLGPLLVASITTVISLNSDKDPWEARSDAEQLLALFREEEKNHVVFVHSTMPDDGKECGYDPTQLFPGDQLLESAQEKRFTPYMGYFMLDQWRKDVKWDEFNSDLVEALETNRSQFEIGFLRRCVSWTLARGLCMTHVEDIVRTVGNDVPRSFDETRTTVFFGYGTENDVVCLYADGVASRIGLPLSGDTQE